MPVILFFKKFDPYNILIVVEKRKTLLFYLLSFRLHDLKTMLGSFDLIVYGTSSNRAGRCFRIYVVQ